MRNWFDTLEIRERMFVMVGGGAIVFAVFYFLVWMPLASGQAMLSTNVSALERAIAELKTITASRSGASNSRTEVIGINQSLVVIVDSTLRERGLYNSLQRSQPTRDNGIRVEFENAAFDDLILWLGELGNRYGLQIISGSFSAPRQDAEGRVNASLTLERG